MFFCDIFLTRSVFNNKITNNMLLGFYVGILYAIKVFRLSNGSYYNSTTIKINECVQEKFIMKLVNKVNQNNSNSLKIDFGINVHLQEKVFLKINEVMLNDRTLIIKFDDNEIRIIDNVVGGMWDLPGYIRTNCSNMENNKKIVVLGAVIKGESDHYELINNSVGKALMDLQNILGVQIINGLINAPSYDLALARARVSVNESKNIWLNNTGFRTAINAILLSIKDYSVLNKYLYNLSELFPKFFAPSK